MKILVYQLFFNFLSTAASMVLLWYITKIIFSNFAAISTKKINNNNNNNNSTNDDDNNNNSNNNNNNNNPQNVPLVISWSHHFIDLYGQFHSFHIRKRNIKISDYNITSHFMLKINT